MLRRYLGSLSMMYIHTTVLSLHINIELSMDLHLAFGQRKMVTIRLYMRMKTRIYQTVSQVDYFLVHGYKD